jgi:cell division protein ZapA
MAEVHVKISGRHYRLACDDGQEEHLAALGRDLDQRIATLRTSFGEIGDMRLAVMAALILADELSEARQKVEQMEEEFRALQQAQVEASDRSMFRDAKLAAAFTAAANRIEQAARLIGQSADDHSAPIG